MNKKLIAVAIAAAVAAPAAMANDTTLYGKVHMSINNVDAGATDQWNVSNHSSRLGVKGSEDLGNGMKAIFKYEMSYSGVDSGTAIGSARNSYIGLAGDFGTFLVGRHDTPAKVAFYAAGNERLGDSIIDLNSNFGFAEMRINNAIAYVSPNFSGFTVAAAIVPMEGAGASTGGLADAVSVGAMYSGMGVKAGLGYTDTDDVLNNSTLLNAGASYTFGAFSIGGQYQETEFGGNEREAWALTGAAGFGNNEFVVMYGETESDDNADTDTLGIALKHKLSKRTTAYAAYRASDTNLGDNAPIAAGKAATPPVNLGSGNWWGNGGTVPGSDAFGIGLIHNF